MIIKTPKFEAESQNGECSTHFYLEREYLSKGLKALTNSNEAQTIANAKLKLRDASDIGPMWVRTIYLK
jgi:hypothetical protein